jgi:hypothetical protein
MLPSASLFGSIIKLHLNIANCSQNLNKAKEKATSNSGQWPKTKRNKNYLFHSSHIYPIIDDV